jgi:uroporphyrinogen III methyltransferase/synthase
MNPEFEALLSRCGAKVTNLVLYRIVKVAPENVEAIDRADWITFASAQTVRNFMEAVGNRAIRAKIACIGPITAKAARQAGLKVAVIPRTFTFDSLIQAIVKAV